MSSSPSVPPHRRPPRFQPSSVCPPPVLRSASLPGQFSLYPPLPLRRAATASHSCNRFQHRYQRPIGSPPVAALSAYSRRPRPHRLQLSALVSPPRHLPSFFHCSRDSFCHASRRSGGVSQFLPQMQSFYPIRRTLSYCTIRVFGHFPPHAPLFCHSARRAVSAQRRSARLSACSPINSFTATAFPTVSLVHCSSRRTVFGHRRVGRSFVNSLFFGPICIALHRPCLCIAFFFFFFFFTFFHVLRLLLFLPTTSLFCSPMHPC